MSASGRRWLPYGVWVFTSAALIAWLSTYELGWVLGVIYVGLNGLALLAEWLHRHDRPERTVEVLGWLAAAQLPVMLWLYITPAVGRFRSDRGDGSTVDTRTARPPGRGSNDRSP